MSARRFDVKAIETRYLGPTDHRGSRIVASDGDGNRITISYRSELNTDQNHTEAALALCAKMGWKGNMAGGWVKRGMVWVFLD